MNSLDNKISDARNSVEEVREALDVAVKALDSLEGAIDDADCIQELTLVWANGSPQIYDLIQSLKLHSAEFTHTEEIL